MAASLPRTTSRAVEQVVHQEQSHGRGLGREGGGGSSGMYLVANSTNLTGLQPKKLGNLQWVNLESKHEYKHFGL